MKRLYQTLLHHELRVFEELGRAAETRTSTEEAILEAERALGASLPKTYKQFATQVGAASWPVQIHPVEALRSEGEGERPSWLIPFASDGGGNDWCFDTRRLERQERPIVFWDHEDPPDVEELGEPGPVTPFDHWLRELISGELAALEREGLQERRRRLEEALLPHRETNAWPWAPSEEDVARLQASMGIVLPQDYVWFATNLGSTPWPLEIPGVLEMERLSERMWERHPASRTSAFAFGRETDGSFVAFRRDGTIVSVGGSPANDRSFFDLLERRIRERSKAGPAPETAGSTQTAADQRTSASAPDPIVDDLPSRIVEDEHTNAVWRAVARAKHFTATPAADGRVQVAIDDFMGGRRRMFLSPEAWATILAHLGALPAR